MLLLQVSSHSLEDVAQLLFLAGGDAERFRDLAIAFSPVDEAAVAMHDTA
jgi:hypothetical protein